MEIWCYYKSPSSTGRYVEADNAINSILNRTEGGKEFVDEMDFKNTPDIVLGNRSIMSVEIHYSMKLMTDWVYLARLVTPFDERFVLISNFPALIEWIETMKTTIELAIDTIQSEYPLYRGTYGTGG